MKLVVNECYGGFSLSQFAVDALGLNSPYDSIDRNNTDLINLIEQYGSEKCSGSYAQLAIEEVPDEATDYRIEEYDGSEHIIYVQNGLIWDV